MRFGWLGAVIVALWLGVGVAGAELPGDLAVLARSGDPEAQFRLGAAYAKGEGIRADVGEAALWFGRAAEGEHVEAMFTLGMMYATGAGVPLDAVLAHKWLHLCARFSAGEERKVALSARNAVTAKMTPEQVVEAQELVTEWLATRAAGKP